jgi:hypothetical protein
MTGSRWSSIIGRRATMVAGDGQFGHDDDDGAGVEGGADQGGGDLGLIGPVGGATGNTNWPPGRSS